MGITAMAILGAILGATLGVAAASSGRSLTYAAVTGAVAALIAGGTFALAAWLSYVDPSGGSRVDRRWIVVGISGRVILHATPLVLAILMWTRDPPDTLAAVIVAVVFVFGLALLLVPHLITARRRGTDSSP